jgi:PAS domain S-box-containing protein
MSEYMKLRKVDGFLDPGNQGLRSIFYLCNMGSDLKPNILIVDDVDLNIFYLKEVLKSLNVNIISAFSGEEALAKIKDMELALALIDVQMPGMDGLELATIINADRTRDIVPVIFITAHAYSEYHLEKYYETGIIDFIIKPFHQTILLSKIKILLELSRQKNKIQESERMYRTLLNASPEGIIIMDLNGDIREISNMTSEIFGIDDKNEFIGKDVKTLFPVEEHAKFNELIEKTIEDGRTQNVEFILTKADQSQFICEISTTLIQENDGRPKAFMAVIRNISERKKIEQHLIHTERMVSLGEMAAGIAHEINQPLNTISLGLENLLTELRKIKGIDELYFHNKATRIFDNISRLDYIIDHIRTFSRSNDGFLQSNFDVNESIKDGISMIAGQFNHRGIALVLELDDNIPQVIGNTYRFEQVIINLLTNAKDALEEKMKIHNPDSHQVIEIKTYERNQYVYVEVKDTGIGIKQDLLDKIMLPFFTTKDAGKGTGLGLSISFGIVKEMNGNIEIQSEFSIGTTVKIIIPVEINAEKKNE